MYFRYPVTESKSQEGKSRNIHKQVRLYHHPDSQGERMFQIQQKEGFVTVCNKQGWSGERWGEGQLGSLT